MFNKVFLISAALFCLVLAGCGTKVVKVDKITTADNSVVNGIGLKLVDTPQDAVFYISTGMDGGMGSMPVLDAQRQYTLLYNDLPVFFSENFGNKVREKLPSCYSGRPEIKVSANVVLEKESGINHSIPPDEDGNQPLEEYYTVRVNKLNDIQVKAEACKD